MSHRSYPRIDQSLPQRKWIADPKAAPKCRCCGKPATHKVEVQINWFRGDDERFNVCDADKENVAGMVATLTP